MYRKTYFKQLVRMALCTEKHTSNTLVVWLMSSTQTINKLLSVWLMFRYRKHTSDMLVVAHV